jgi:hypothetical protein
VEPRAAAPSPLDSEASAALEAEAPINPNGSQLAEAPRGIQENPKSIGELLDGVSLSINATANGRARP